MGEPVRALSLTRPWTTLVLSGQKMIENRTWKTTHRGPLIIHGARSWDSAALEVTANALGAEAVRTLIARRNHPCGYLGVVDLTDICSASVNSETVVCDCGPWAFPRQHHWKLANPRIFPQAVPGAGQLGLWAAPAEALLLARAVTV